MAETYTKKLVDPRWQRKRLEIYQRDNFKCTVCKKSHLQLELHHVDYIPGIEPWEYPNDMFLTLCYECHAKEQGRAILEPRLAISLRMNGFTVGDMVALSCYIDTNEKFRNLLFKIIRQDV